MFDFYQSLFSFFKDNPFLFTNCDVKDGVYISYFQDKYGPLFDYRLPFVVEPHSFVNDFRQNIVQTHSNIIQHAGGNMLIYTTILQFSPQEHVSLGYTAQEEELAASVSVYLSDPSIFLDWVNKIEKYKKQEKKKSTVVGFGAAIKT